MKILGAIGLAAGLALLVGCGNGLTSDFEKSGRYAFVLVKKATEHETILERDVTTAFAQAEAAAKSDSDRETLEILGFYKNAFLTNDYTPLAENEVKACEQSLNRIFDEKAEPREAAKPFTDALMAKTDQMLKEQEGEKAGSPGK